MKQPGPLRIFATILRPSAAILAAYAAILAWAGYLGWVSPGEFGQMRPVYVVLLLCQSFSAATGFCVQARRGHFDQALVVPASRTAVGLAHATVSMGTGLITWLLVATIEALVNRRDMPLGFTPPALAAVFYMSAVAWAAALPFARYSSGVAWLILSIALAGAGKLLVLRQAYAAAAEPAGDLWRAVGAALVFPPLMVTEPSAPMAISTFVVLAAAIVVIGSGVLAIEAFDFPLVDPS
jgi:hypothetical protein